ncbi:MAG: nuclear transport factor 2 family protein, partial [Trueperaceae bacterium]
MTDSDMLELERRFWFGDADFYRQLLTADCRMALPGMGLVDRKVAIDGIAAGPRWDEVEFAERDVRRLGDDGVIVSYRARARRGAAQYEAVVASVYANEDGHWKLAYHQQTARFQTQGEA